MLLLVSLIICGSPGGCTGLDQHVLLHVAHGDICGWWHVGGTSRSHFGDGPLLSLFLLLQLAVKHFVSEGGCLACE